MNDPQNDKYAIEVRPTDKVAPDENSSSQGPSAFSLGAFLVAGLVAGGLARHFDLVPPVSEETSAAILTVCLLIGLPLAVSIRSDFRRARQKRLVSALRNAEPEFFQYVERIAPRLAAESETNAK